MSNEAQKPEANSRREFLTGVLATGAAAAAAVATPAAQAQEKPHTPSALPPSGKAIEGETGTAKPVQNRIGGVAGSDFMMDVIKTLNIKYMPANCASSFRALHESLINYGGNKMPEFITCCHEESSVAMAHGYFKAEGKPMAVLCHGTVGLQHAAMGIYNAYCDRVPVYILAGNTLDATMRRPGVEWDHSEIGRAHV